MWDRTTRYGEIASQMRDEIGSGVFQPGDKLPSIRALCERFQASSATVTHALYLLEDAGMIVARRRSGFYICDTPHATGRARQSPREPVPDANLSARGALLQELDRHLDRDQPLLFARLNPELYPVVPLQRIMTDLARRNPELFTTGCRTGDTTLETLLARRGRVMGCDWSAEDVTITLGGDECRRFLLRLLTRPGDTVGVASPCELRLLEELDALGLKVLEIPAHPQHGLSIDTLDFALSREKVAACVLSANFPHPTGSLMSDDAKRRTVELLEKHQVPLIEDDRCGDLYFGKSRPLPFKAFDRTGRVHYVADFGHLIGPGMSIGFAVTELREKLELIARPPALFQQTMASFMSSGLFEPHLRRLRHTLADYARQYQEAVRRHFPIEARGIEVAGGHWMWVEMPGGFDTTKLLRRAMEADIAFVPGQLFSMDGRLNHCLRLNMGMPMTERIERNIARLGAMLAEQMMDLRVLSI